MVLTVRLIFDWPLDREDHAIMDLQIFKRRIGNSSVDLPPDHNEAFKRLRCPRHERSEHFVVNADSLCYHKKMGLTPFVHEYGSHLGRLMYNFFLWRGNLCTTLIQRMLPKLICLLCSRFWKNFGVASSWALRRN